MWFEHFTERIGGPAVFDAMASRPRRVDAVRRGQGRDAPDGFVGVHAAIELEPGLREDEARVSGLPDGERRQGQARRHRGNPTNFYSVTASGAPRAPVSA